MSNSSSHLNGQPPSTKVKKMNKELRRVIDDIESVVKNSKIVKVSLQIKEFDKVFRFQIDFRYYDNESKEVEPLYGLMDELRDAGVCVYAEKTIESTGAKAIIPPFVTQGTYAFYLDYNYEPLTDLMQRVFYEFK